MYTANDKTKRYSKRMDQIDALGSDANNWIKAIVGGTGTFNEVLIALLPRSALLCPALPCSDVLTAAPLPTLPLRF
jgi:hypothetical protein